MCLYINYNICSKKSLIEGIWHLHISNKDKAPLTYVFPLIPSAFNALQHKWNSKGTICCVRASCRCRTVALETGMQNTQLCSTIVQLSFSTEDLNHVFTFPLIYSIFQIAFAAIFLGSKEERSPQFIMILFSVKSWSC